jgi:hypothetical protein
MASANRSSSFALFRLGPIWHLKDPDIQPARRADATAFQDKPINLVVVAPDANFGERVQGTLGHVVDVSHSAIRHPAIDLHGQATIKRLSDFAELFRYVAMIFAANGADDRATSEVFPVVIYGRRVWKHKFAKKFT